MSSKLCLKSIFTILITLFAGCATFHSRLFVTEGKGAEVNGLHVFPTIVAYENTVDEKRDFITDHDFWVELRVADTLTQFPKKFLHVSQEHQELLDARNNFRQRVMSDFTVDSMIVAYLPSNERVVLPAIVDVPGWKWQLIFRFGSVSVPDSVSKLEVIVPFHYVDSVGSELKHDSVMFTMYRYESHLKQLWAEEIPNNLR